MLLMSFFSISGLTFNKLISSIVNLELYSFIISATSLPIAPFVHFYIVYKVVCKLNAAVVLF